MATKHNSKAEADTTLASFSLDLPPSTAFLIKRRSNPAAAFAELVAHCSAIIANDKEISGELSKFKGDALTQQDARRLAVLEQRCRLGIKIGALPVAIGPGLALMYDAALETLRSSDEPIDPGMFDPTTIRSVASSLGNILPLIGSLSATALELAFDDTGFRDRLEGRVSEIETTYMIKFPQLEECDHCVIVIRDADGNVVDERCGTEEECRAMGGLIVVALLVLLWKGLKKLFS